MYETATLKEKISLFFKLLLPILVTQVGLFLMNFFDTIMSGRAGPEDLAGVAIGASLWVPIFTGVNGILLAITPIIGHLIGANDKQMIKTKVQQGVYLASILAVLVFIFGAIVLNPILNVMSLDPEVDFIAKYYLITLIFGVVPLFIFTVLRAYIDALGHTRISMLIILISLPINIGLNYIFIFGKLGVPAYGGVGSGIATALTYWLICLIAIIMIAKMTPFKKHQIFTQWAKPSLTAWWEQLRIGVPMGLAMFFETSIFSAVTLLMSVYSTYTIAAHQAAMNFSSLLYMVPLSVSMALTIAVGYELGAKRFASARAYTYIGLATGIFTAIFAGIILYVFNDVVAGLYNTDPEVINLTKNFIIFAIFFQLADAFGAPIQGALRGYKDVNMTLLIALVSYWVIGLPSGYLLANYTSLQPYGYWVGLIIGLSAGAFALVLRLRHIEKKYQHTT